LTITLLSIGALIFVSVGTAKLVWILMDLRRRVEETERKVAQLEHCQKTRLPYKVSEGLEDVIAVALDSQLILSAALQRKQTELNILQALRGGQYDPETPAGMRPEGAHIDRR